jgi:hypothetical protein
VTARKAGKKSQRGSNPPPYANDTVSLASLWRLLRALDDRVDGAGQRLSTPAGAERIAAQARPSDDALVSRVVYLARPVADPFHHLTTLRRQPACAPAHDRADHDEQPATTGPPASRRSGSPSR